MVGVMDFTELSFQEKMLIARDRFGRSLEEAKNYGTYITDVAQNKNNFVPVTGQDYCRSEQIKTAIFKCSKKEICMFLPMLPLNTPEYNVVFNEFKIGTAVEGFLKRGGKLKILVQEEAQEKNPLQEILHVYDYFNPGQIEYALTSGKITKSDEKECSLITGDDNIHYYEMPEIARSTGMFFDNSHTVHPLKLFSQLQKDASKKLTLKQ